MEEALQRGAIFILEIEVQGTRQLRDNGVVGEYIFIVPPDMDVLRHRLTGRRTNSPEEIEARLEIAADEMRFASLYDFVVVNRELHDTIAQVAERIGL
jgi:guanylate kinase